MILNIIQNIVNQMIGFSLTYGDNSFRNLLNDEIVDKGIHLDHAENSYQLAQSGYIGEVYFISLIFMYKSQLDWLPTQHESLAINPANNSIREFISLCQASELINSVKLTKNSVEFINLLDVNVSGKILYLTIEPNIEKSVCI